MAQTTNFSQVERYFVDAHGIRKLFEEIVTEEKLTTDILQLYGDGGLGKSSLMAVCQSFCRTHNIASALVSGDDIKDTVSLLHKLARAVTHTKLKFPSFEKKFREYQIIQAKVTAMESRNRTDRVDAAKIAVSGVGDVAKTVLPVPGAPVDVAVKTISALIDALGKTISKEDVALYIDAAERLSECFQDDLGRYVKNRRAVILLDTYEQLLTLDDWICKWAAALPDNVLLLIAGRNPLYGRWFAPSQTKRVKIVELKEMPSDKIGILLRRYYAAAGLGEPDDTRINEIIGVASGSPLKAVFAAQTGSPNAAVGEAYRRLRRGTSKEMVEALDAVSVVRWFNQEVLRSLVDPRTADGIYDELTALHAIRTRSEGRALHDTIAEDTRSYLRWNDPERLSGLHGKALTFYERSLSMIKAKGSPPEAAQRTILEVLYQHFQLEPQKWIVHFRPIFDDWFLKARDFTFCRQLINDARTYVRDSATETWLDFYDASIGMLSSESKAKSRERLEQLQKRQELSPDLRIQVLELLATSGWYDTLSDGEGTDRAERIYESLYSLHAARNDQAGYAKALIWLGILRQRTKGGGIPHFREALSILQPADPANVELIAKARHELAIALRMRGAFKESAETFHASEAAYSKLELRFERAHSMFNQGFLRIWLGDILGAERLLKASKHIFESAGHASNIERAWPLIGLSRVALERGEFSRSLAYCADAAEVWGSDLFGRAVCGETEAEVYVETAELPRAIQLLDNTETSITVSRDMFLSAWALRTRGYALLGQRSFEPALSCFEKGWRLIREYGSTFGEAELALGVCRACLALRRFDEFENVAGQVQNLAEGEDTYIAQLAGLSVLRGLAWLNAEPAADKAAQASRFITDGLLLALQFNIFTLDKLLTSILGQCPPPNDVISGIRSLWSEATIDGVAAAEYELERRKEEGFDSSHRRTLLDRLA